MSNPILVRRCRPACLPTSVSIATAPEESHVLAQAVRQIMTETIQPW